MKILVCGSGVIGSLLIHTLVVANNDVSVLARNQRSKELKENGLRIKFSNKKEIYTDQLTVVESIPQDIHYDIIFSVMQYSQQFHLLEDLAKANTEIVVLVGNNISSQEMKETILSHSTNNKKVLFGFQGTGGTKEKDYTEVFSVGKADMVIGEVDKEVDDNTKQLIELAFNKKTYELQWMDHMDAWYKCHLAFVIPCCYLAYSVHCDLKKTTSEERKLLLDASNEVFEALKSLGYPMRPVNEDTYYKPGMKRLILVAMMYVLAKTKYGDIALTNHCKHAVNEMKILATKLEEMIDTSEVDFSKYKELKALSPSWEDLEKEWN